jgi:hypothetical protein
MRYAMQPLQHRADNGDPADRAGIASRLSVEIRKTFNAAFKRTLLRHSTAAYAAAD